MCEVGPLQLGGNWRLEVGGRASAEAQIGGPKSPDEQSQWCSVLCVREKDKSQRGAFVGKYNNRIELCPIVVAGQRLIVVAVALWFAYCCLA